MSCQPSAADVQTLRDRFVAADNAGDADALIDLLADDVVILHPLSGVFEGKEAVAAFIRSVITEVHAQFEKQASYRTIELITADHLAYERGHFAQVLSPKNGEAASHEAGMYLWIYARDGDGIWKISRIAGTIDTASEHSE